MNFRHILLVDDDVDDIAMLEEALKHYMPDVTVSLLENGRQLVEYVKSGPLPDIFIIDLNMPVMNGVECIKVLRQNEQLSHIPILVFTTSNNASDIQTCKAAGADYYIVKPYSIPDLFKVAELISTGNLKSIY